MVFDKVDIKTVNSALGFMVGDKVKVTDKNHNINKELYIIFITEYTNGKYFFHCSYDKDRKIVRYYFGVNQIEKVNV